ncbi:unnamed protein product [Chilo suppressalis]|uniref:Odorant binding protein n=1 Tax=Chilo suppressalis TaxID=168631 RepID=A0ABN8BA36_CHISP|nr:hypothetical protein evm_000917 [Chilo suppressalis]CAH0405492.1 unnamed protein product [Chilo suppressalis]
MKSIVFLCLVVAAAGMDMHHGVHLSESQKEKANQYIMECVKQSGVHTDVLVNAKKGQYADDEALKKFTLCFFQKSGIVDQTGKLNVDAALSKLPESVNKHDATKLLEECKNKTGKDAADTAFEIFKCYSKGTKTHILL